MPSVPTDPIELQITHLSPRASYRIELHRTGYETNDVYSAYIKLGSPKDLSAAQIAQLNDLTQDLPEKQDMVRSDKNGSITVTVPMHSNDIVLLTLTYASKKK